MKTFLALAVLALATSVTTQAAPSATSSKIYRPKITSVIVAEFGTTRVPQRPKLDLIPTEDNGANRQPPRLAFRSIDGSELNRMPSRPKFTALEGTDSNRLPTRPKFGETNSDRMPRLTRANFIAAKGRPKVQSAAVTTL